MPDADGLLSHAEKVLMWNWLSERWTQRACPCCGVEKWVGANHVLMDVPYAAPNRSIDRRPQIAVPYVVAFCENCAYTVRFNAYMIPGLFDADRNATGGIHTHG